MLAIRYSIDPGAYEPAKAHEEDAGYDLRAIVDGFVPAHGRRVFDTGVHIAMPCGHAEVRPRSGLMANHGILTDSIIDKGYGGAVKVCLFNLSDTPYMVKRGDKIAQLVYYGVGECILERVDAIASGERGANGFGSTGR